MNEPEEMGVGKFIGGLREDLREKLEVIPHLTFENACNSALVHEKYAKKKSTYVQPYKPTQPRSQVNNTSTGSLGTSNKDPRNL